MKFEETLQRAKEYDKKAMLQIVEMYRPLMIKYSKVHEVFDEDLYQEHVYTMLKCIRTFSEDKYTKDK
ncbi:MAG: helix-turn-helix domain-containing protein [Eubacteriales bacterium]|nr:helix-turn-helix domain-containing protein [Eubacteriales bacterium]